MNKKQYTAPIVKCHYVPELSNALLDMSVDPSKTTNQNLGKEYDNFDDDF